MFGYVRPLSKELKVKELELYKSAYCGLCGVMGKLYSPFFRLTLSYDYVFLIFTRLALSPEKVTFKAERCLAHPTKKRAVMQKNAALDYAAGISSLFFYRNLKDKINDKDGAKSFFGRFLLPFALFLRKKAIKNGFGELDEKLSNGMENLCELEKQNEPSPDKTSDFFGQMLSDCFAYGLDQNEMKIASEIGMSVGKWIYIIDALDDYEKDEKKSNYNPLLNYYGGKENIIKHLDEIDSALLLTLSRADTALSETKTTDEGVFNILQNTIRFGLPALQVKLIKEKLTK